MRIARKHFTHPTDPERREVTVEEKGWFGKVTKTVKVDWYEPTTEDVLNRAKEFINSIGCSRLVSVSEHTSAYERIGDDGRWTIVVWYWEDEVEPQEVPVDQPTE